MYFVRIDLEMQRPKIVQGWRAENYMRVGTALAYRSVSWYILYHDHRIAIRIVSWPTRIVTPLQSGVFKIWQLLKIYCFI